MMVTQANKLLKNKQDFLFNIDILDTKTDKLFSIIKNIVRVIEFQKCKEEIHSVFFSLAHYTDHYLIDLEIALKDKKCKNLANQIAHNKLFANYIIKFQDDFKLGKEMLCKNLLEFILEWTKKQKEIDQLSFNELQGMKTV
jgi:hemerythrin